MNYTRWIGASLVMASAAAATTAHATPDFPKVIQDTLGLAPTAEPDCSLCHVGPQNAQSVQTPFGRTVRARGLVAYDSQGLKNILTSMAADKVDSDQDGLSDTDELENGTDPNVANGADGGFESVEPPSYGCRVAPLGATTDLAGHLRCPLTVLGLAGGGLAYRRRRRRPAPPAHRQPVR